MMESNLDVVVVISFWTFRVSISVSCHRLVQSFVQNKMCTFVKVHTSSYLEAGDDQLTTNHNTHNVLL